MDITKEIQVFCSNICFLREKYHLSTKSMAMLIDVEEDDLRLLESGHLPDAVTVHILFRLHKVFAMPIDTFFTVPLNY